LLTHVKPHSNGFDPNGFWGISHACGLNPTQMAILRELYLMRDKEAQRRDRPPFKIMHDKTLVSIAKHQPRDLQQLEQVPDMPEAKRRQYKWHILEAVEKGINAPPPRRPQRKPRNEHFHHRYEQLHRWRKLKGRERKVESDIILPREILVAIARTAPRTLAELEPVMAPLVWRFHTYGDEILQALCK